MYIRLIYDIIGDTSEKGLIASVWKNKSEVCNNIFAKNWNSKVQSIESFMEK